MPQIICNHPTTVVTHEPDGSPEGGYWVVVTCTVCLQVLSRTHVIG